MWMCAPQVLTDLLIVLHLLCTSTRSAIYYLLPFCYFLRSQEHYQELLYFLKCIYVFYFESKPILKFCLFQYDAEFKEFRLHSIMSEHKKTITAISWNPKDPNLLATASADNQVRASNSSFEYVKGNYRIRVVFKDTCYTWSLQTAFFYILLNIFFTRPSFRNLRGVFLTKGP